MARYKQHTGTSNESNLTKAPYIEDAEKIANIVTTKSYTQNYSGMNEQLSEIVNTDDEKDTYVFAHPGVFCQYIAIVPVVILSIVFLYCLFIGISTYHFSSASELLSVGLLLIITSAVALIINVVLLVRLISTIKFKSRFDIYERMLGYRSFEFVEEIAITAKQKEPLVVKDLRRAIKQKLIPHGHFSNDNRVLMVSNEIYDSYHASTAVHDCYFQKVYEDRLREKSRTKRISQLMETGEQYIEKIHGYGIKVKDKRITRMIAKMKTVIALCFHELDATPKEVQSFSIFLNCYMATTERLLDAYIGMDTNNNQVSNKPNTQLRKEIIHVLNTVIIGFDSILKKLCKYQETELFIK